MMRTRRNTRSRSLAVYGFLLGLYAPEFLARHRAEMLQNFEDLENASSSKAALWLLIGEDLMLSFISRKIPKSFWGQTAPMVVLLAVVFGIWRASAYDTAPVNDPKSLEFSQSRLARIAAWQQTQVEAGAISGAVAAIARNGKVAYLQAVGFRDRARTIPLQSDSIFWIASMTKPVTSVAAMILVEEGKLDLAAPVHQYLPEFKDMMVGVERADPASGQSRLVLEPQKRSMTVEDLLRHTSGLTYFDRGNTAVHKLYRDSGLYVEGMARDGTLKDFVSRLSRLPLAHQPGEAWEYGHSADVLGRVVEVASGQSLDQFLESRLFKPIGMVDTAFWVPPEKLARLIDPPAGALIYPDRDVTKPTTLFSGGGGLVSTAADYLRFCQMLLNGGELDGVRILSPATVRRMTTDARPPNVRFTDGDIGQGGASFGLGFGIRSNAAASWVPGSVGSFTWSGAWGTHFWIDPAEQLIAIQLVQITKDYDQFRRQFRNLTYGAFLIPDHDIPASPPAAIDQIALEDLVGKYDFGQSSSSRDKTGTTNNFSGIGADVELTGTGVRILRPLDNSPSAQAGLKPGDIITEIDDVTIRGLTLAQIIARLRGPVNSQTRLKISRAQDAPTEVAVTRAPIYIPGVELQIKIDAGNLVAEATGPMPILDFEKGKPVRLQAISSNEFFIDGVDHTRITFERDRSGKVASAVLNPGQWEQRGRLITRRAS
jgi:CubicO group peptidase (beta-lactamase class C family)